MKHNLSLLLMALLIAASVVLGTWRGLSGLENDLEAAFVNGVEGDGYSIRKDLDTVYRRSADLMAAAQRTDGVNTVLLEAVSADRDRLNAASGPADCYNACMALVDSVKSLYFSIMEPSVELRMAYGDITSAVETMKLDGYNALVLDYNVTLGRFPANLLGGLLGFAPAELFG